MTEETATELIAMIADKIDYKYSQSGKKAEYKNLRYYVFFNFYSPNSLEMRQLRQGMVIHWVHPRTFLDDV